jgi:hypothetical protein
LPIIEAVLEQRIARINRIVQKDEKDGKTYLKIPVENEKVIENVLALFAGIFNQKKS